MVTGNNLAIKPIIELADKSIATIPANECHLSILYTKGGLSFCITRIATGKVLLIAEYELTISRESEAINELLSQFDESFSSTALSVITLDYTFIPTVLYDAANKAKYASLIWNSEGKPVLEQSLDELEISVLFQWDQSIIDQITKKFPNIITKPQCIWSIQRISHELKRRPGDHLFAHFQKEQFEITAFRNGHLLFNNCFSYQSNEDALYHVMNVFEQLKINPDSVPFKVSGNIDYKGALQKLLENYIRDVRIETIDDTVLSSVFTKDHGIHHHNLIQLFTCV